MFKSTILGRFVSDPETKTITTANGETALTTFSLAAASSRKKDVTSFINNVTAWGKQAEVIAKNFKKGDMILIFTENENRRYDNKEGVSVSVTDYTVSGFEFVGGKKSDTVAAVADVEVEEEAF